MTRKVWTAAELEAMDPSEVDAIFEEDGVRVQAGVMSLGFQVRSK